MTRKRSGRLVLALAATLVIGGELGCSGERAGSVGKGGEQTEPRQGSGGTTRVREAAVAGLFYPRSEAELARTIEALLVAAPAHGVPRLRALVCPHAGYVYSGPTAAAAYRTVVGRDIQTVVILAPSHYAWFEGASVADAEFFQTPLGRVPISEKARALAGTRPFVLEPECRVQRPQWWPQSSRRPPEGGRDTPETWEHSDEVQVPFLQKVLKGFKVLPVVLGQVDPASVAEGLTRQLDEKTLIVASSDLSHYHGYDEARELDRQCVEAICSLDLQRMQAQEACGKLPVLALMHVAKRKGWKARWLDSRNSGDTSGDKQRVVGYAAVAFYEPTRENYTLEERKQLVSLARKTVEQVVTQGQFAPVDAKTLPAKFAEPKGCFVTLKKDGALRGCIGHIFAREPLYQAVLDNARGAALHDTRFPPVKPDELSHLEIELSILTEPQRLKFSSPEELLSQLEPYRDGVVLQVGARTATYLPQVWEQIPDKAMFLSHLAEKAGCEPAAWRLPSAEVLRYQVEAFKESEL